MLQESPIIKNQFETPYPDEEEVEVELSNPEGIKCFSKEVEELYADAMKYRAVELKKGDKRLRLPGVTEKDFFETIYEQRAELQTVLQAREGIAFSECEMVHIQELYNELYMVATYIISQFELSELDLGSDVFQNKEAEEGQFAQQEEMLSGEEEEIEMFGRLRRGNLNIVESQEEEVQKIQIIRKQEEQRAPEVSIEKNPTNQLFTEAREADPVVTNVPMPSPGVMKPAEELGERSLTGQYLFGDEEYRDFIEQHYSSPLAFERLIDMKITKFEAQFVDVFERWLGEEFQSPFSFLQDKSVAEVFEISQNPEVRQYLAEKNIKYEAFVAWTDLIEEMQEVVQLDVNQTFGELFARWFIESELAVSSSRN